MELEIILLLIVLPVFIVWLYKTIQQVKLKKEIKHLREHLHMKMEIDAEGNAKLKAELEDLKKQRISLPTANPLISDFEKLDILHERTGWERNREVVNLLKLQFMSFSIILHKFWFYQMKIGRDSRSPKHFKIILPSIILLLIFSLWHNRGKISSA